MFRNKLAKAITAVALAVALVVPTGFAAAATEIAPASEIPTMNRNYTIAHGATETFTITVQGTLQPMAWAPVSPGTWPGTVLSSVSTGARSITITNNATLTAPVTVTMHANMGTPTAARIAFNFTLQPGGVTPTPTPTPAPNLTLGTASWNPGNGAANTTVSVTSNTNWTASSNANWLTVTPGSGSNNGTLSLGVNFNIGAQRVGTITVSATGVPNRTVTVTQAAGNGGNATFLWVGNIGGTFFGHNISMAGGTGDVRDVRILSDGVWTATSTQHWLTVSQDVGFGDQTVTVTAAPNNTGVGRAGVIRLTAGDLVRTIIVGQADVRWDLTGRTVPASGAVIPVTVTSNAYWAVASTSWSMFNVPPSIRPNNEVRRTGTYTFNLTITPNTTGAPRTHDIILNHWHDQRDTHLMALQLSRASITQLG